jgi:hypothetical protein
MTMFATKLCPLLEYYSLSHDAENYSWLFGRAWVAKCSWLNWYIPIHRVRLGVEASGNVS